VDDQPLMRVGVAQFLAGQRGLEICGEAEGPASAKMAVEKHRPDLVLLELMLGHSDGINLIKYWNALHPEMVIVIFTNHDEASTAERALRAGASGYVLKRESPGRMLEAVRRALRGEAYASRRIRALLSHKGLGLAESSEAAKELALSDREFHVFGLLGAGLGTRQIAQELGLSGKTIEGYRERIKEKLSLASGAELVERAKAWIQGKSSRQVGLDRWD
jgi:DNA-binding NarL/FixJ family response regulator